MISETASSTPAPASSAHSPERATSGGDQLTAVTNDAHQYRDRDRERELESQGRRKSTGAYYTPSDVVDQLLDVTLQPIIDERSSRGLEAVAGIRVLDPSCGAGNFLVGAAARLSQSMRGLGASAASAAEIAYGRCVIGVDIDDDVVNICQQRLEERAAQAGAPRPIYPAIVSGDALLAPIRADDAASTSRGSSADFVWGDLFHRLDIEDGGCDLVVGNPPFLNQLSTTTARTNDYTRQLVERFGAAVAGYTDPAALFLLLATELARPSGGTCAMIEPVSFLTSRDATEVRSKILRRGHLSGLWFAGERIFDATVEVCAPIVRVDDRDPATRTRTPIRLFVGRDFADRGTTDQLQIDEATWSRPLSCAMGIPANAVPDTVQVLGDVAEATADFRDQYYGLASHTRDIEHADDTELPKLVTAGLIDPATIWWGSRSTRFNKVTYLHPRVEIAALDDGLQEWAAKRMVPKILVATQTRVLEAWVDLDGNALPSVPVITVTAPNARLWHIAAAFTSPVVTMIAAQRHLGAALSGNALKLSAKQLLDLPLPSPSTVWDRAAALFQDASTDVDGARRRDHLLECGRLMCEVYDVADPETVLAWWADRLPRDRSLTGQ